MSQLLFDSLHQGLQRVLDLRQAQHSLTAANIANADTPGYKARVIPFDKVLEDAVQGEGGMLGADDGHASGAGADLSNVRIEELEAPPWALDGNSVVAEREAARLAENAMLYTGVSQGITRRMALLRYAASDGK
ncbi:MAG: flagellar basal body rod protein FlgB [Pseudomonadota bacterium]